MKISALCVPFLIFLASCAKQGSEDLPVSVTLDFKVTASAETFGVLLSGAESEELEFKFENKGNVPLGGCATPEIIEGNFDEFEITKDECGTSAIPRGGSCKVWVKAKPTSPGEKAAALVRRCIGGAKGIPMATPLTALAIYPDLAWTPAPYDFGDVFTLSTTAEVDFTFSNSGTAPATGCTAPTLSGTDAAKFTITADTCSTNDLAVGDDCLVKVTASPGALGVFSADLVRDCIIGDAGHKTTLTVTGVQTAPVSDDITPASFDEDIESDTITLSYSDDENDLAVSCAVSNLSNITVTQACACDGAGVCTLKVTGTADYNGPASFDYTVTTGTLTSNTSTATLTIDPVDDAPASANISPASFDEDTESATITLSYADIESDKATACTISNLNHVTVSDPCTCDGAGVCTLKVTGTADYNGAASFKYTVTANGLDSNLATASFTIDPTSDAPVSSDFSPASFDEDTQSGTITLSYTDADSDKATACTISNLSNVTVTQACACNGAGVCTLKVTGTADYNGAASFDFTVTANGQDSNVSTATLTIDSVDDAPVSADISPASFTQDLQSGTITLSYTDLESDKATSCTISNLSNVTVTQACACDGAGVCTLKVTGTSGYSGAASFDYTVTANSLTSNTSTATLTIDPGFLDSDNSASGFAGGTHYGTAWSTNKVILANSGGCDATTTNCAELDSSWTPKYANIMQYFRLDGSLGAISNGSTITATIGTNGTVGNGTSYTAAKVAQGMTFSNAVLTVNTNSEPETNTAIMFWYKATSGGMYRAYLSNGASNDREIYLSGGNLCGRLWNNDGIGQQTICSTGRAYNDNNWHHVVHTYGAAVSGQKLYVDGELVASGTQTSSGFSWEDQIQIGLNGYGGSLAGLMDEFAIFNTTLTQPEVISIFNRQSAKYSGSFLSRVFNAGAANAWDGFKWMTTLPFGKELPDNATSETSTNYSSLVGSTGSTSDNNLMSGNVGLWHMNDNWNDTSGSNANGTASGSVGFSTVSKFGSHAGSFDGVDDSVSIPAINLSGTNKISISLWYRTPSTPSGSNRFLFENSTDFNGEIVSFNVNHQTSGKIGCSLRGDVGYATWTSAAAISLNEWHHITCILDKSLASNEAYLYLDGALNGSNNGNNNDNTNNFGNLVSYIGSRAATTAWTTGYLDELAIWNRALHASEVAQLYRRGANRIKHQVRTCTASDCSDNPTWIGGDGSNSTYFSELQNNSSISAAGDPLGTVASGLANFLFSSFSGVSVPNRQYFQYRTILESDDTGTSCNYGAGATFCSPELKSVEITP